MARRWFVLTMRVVYCTDTYLPQVNGVSVVTDISVRGLMARGWEVEVIAPRYPRQTIGARPDVFGVPRTAVVHSIRSVPAPRYPELRMALPDAWTVYRTIQRAAPDLVHCATEFMIGRLGLWAANRLGIPVVTSYHTNFRQYAEVYGLGGLGGMLERYLARFHRAAWRTYTPSESSRAELLRLGVEEVEVWGRGVDLAQFRPDQRSAQLRITLGVRQAFTFLYVGRLAPEKNVAVVIRAFAKLLERVRPDAIRLVIAGSGPDEAALRESAPPGTVFLGNLDRTRDLPALYATADAFVFASTTETLGLVVLEAMASGLPVLATPAGGVAEFLRDGVNGLAFAANDADGLAHRMHQLVAGSHLSEALGAGALATARALGWDAEVERLDRSYRAICANAQQVRELPLRLNLKKL